MHLYLGYNMRKLQVNIFFKFCLFIIIFFLIQAIIKYFYISDNLLFEHYSQELSDASAKNKIENYQKTSWIIIIAPIVFYALRFILIAALIATGLFLSETKFKLHNLLKCVVLAEYLYILKQIIKLFWFGFIKTDYNLDEFNGFGWDSIGAWCDISNFPIYFRVPLNTVNLFTVLYVFVIAFLLKKEIQTSYLKSLSISIKTYGTGLVLWIFLIMFLLINIS